MNRILASGFGPSCSDVDCVTSTYDQVLIIFGIVIAIFVIGVIAIACISASDSGDPFDPDRHRQQ